MKFECPIENLRLRYSLKSLSLIWSWLKGLWGSTGGLYFPKSGYYLTLINSDKKVAELTRSVITRTGLSWSEHKNEFTLRSHEDITTFLYKIGITSGALELENRALIKSARNKANLASNYDTANIRRSVRASQEQLRLSEEIMMTGKIGNMPEKLRELVLMRIRYPDYTLDELGRELKPAVKKSTVKYRWQKLRSLLDAENEREKGAVNPE